MSSISKQGVINASGSPNPNMISGTNRAEFSTTTQQSPSDGMMYGGSGGNGTFLITKDDTVPIGNYSYNVTGNTSGNRDFQQHGIPYIQGEVYTGSFWAKGSGTCLYRVWDVTTNTKRMSVSYTLTNEWKFYSHTFTATQEMQTNRCSFQVGISGSGNIQICGMKLEQNDHPTPWCLNQYDKNYNENNGLIENNTIIYDNISTKIGNGYIQSNEFIEI